MPSSLPTILLVGGRGYVGCRLAVYFAKLGWTVRIGSRDSSPFQAFDSPAISVVKLDWNDNSTLEKACEGCDYVVQLAAPNEIVAAESKFEAINGTITTAARIVAAAEAAKVSRLLYFSTAHIYGSPLAGHLDEGTIALPRHPYSITHRCAEDFVLSASQTKLLPIVIRLSNALGAPVVKETDRWKLVGNDLCRQVVETGEIRLLSDGSALRDFIPMADVCNAVRFLLEMETDEPRLLVNVGSNHCYEIREIAEIVSAAWEKRSGRKVPIHLGPPGKTAPPFIYSNEKLLSYGFQFSSNIEEEIEATLDVCETWFSPA